MLFVFYPPSPGASTSSLPWGDINAAPFKIRWEDETQAISAHWRVPSYLRVSAALRQCPLFPFVFSPVEYFFSFYSLDSNLFFYNSFAFCFIFSTVSYLLIHVFTPMWPPASREVHLCAEKGSNISLVGFTCICVFIQICCWIFEASHSLLSKIYWVEIAASHFIWKKQRTTRAKMKALGFPQSTVHISRPYEALEVHPSPAVNNPSWPPPLTVPSQNKQGEPCVLLE